MQSGEFKGHQTPHRMPQNIGLGDVQVRQQLRRVARHMRDGYRRVERAGASRGPVVGADQGEMWL